MRKMPRLTLGMVKTYWRSGTDPKKDLLEYVTIDSTRLAEEIQLTSVGVALYTLSKLKDRPY